MTRASNFSFSTSCAAASLGLPGRPGGHSQAFRGDAPHLFALGLLDAHQGGIAQLADARLDGEQRRQRHFHVLEPAVLQLALHADAARALFHLHDDGGVRHGQQLGENHAGLAVAQVVGLQAGENEVRVFALQRRRQEPRAGQRIECRHVFLDVDGAVRALGESFADGRSGARRAGAQRHYFAAVPLLELQPGFQGVSVRLVDFVREIAFLDPLSRRRDAQL